jgi:hypothetical protein
MAIGDVWQYVVRGSVLQQLQVWVFHYKTLVANLPDLDDCIAALDEAIPGSIQAVLTNDVDITHSALKQVTGGTNYFEHDLSPAGGGEVVADTMPPAVCWTFRYARTQLGRRHGYKRFSGVPETWVDDGKAASNIIVNLQNLAAILETNVDVNETPTFQPVILHRMINGQEVTPPVAQEIGGVQFSHVGTQNSRKFGRGA